MAQMEEIKVVVSRVNSENVDSDFFDFISFSKTMHELVDSLKC